MSALAKVALSPFLRLPGASRRAGFVAPARAASSRTPSGAPSDAYLALAPLSVIRTTDGDTTPLVSWSQDETAVVVFLRSYG